MPDLLLELRSEEIPARMQRKAAGDLKKMVTDGLVDAGLTYEAAREYWTPRRLVLDLRGLTARSRDVREERKGPSTKAPEQAIQGFLRAAGLSSIGEAHVHTDPKKGDFYVAHTVKPGRAAEEIIAELVPAVIRAFPWPKSMRWGAASARPGSLRWVRPLQSIVCTFGPETEEPVVVAFEIDGIRSGNVTYGHRFHAPDAITVRRFDDYAAKLEAAKVVIDADRRKEIIAADARNIAFANGLELVEDDGLLEEVSGLVEWPVVLMGEFEEAYLEIPAEVIRLTIRANQKCFVCSPTSPLRGGRAEGAGGRSSSSAAGSEPPPLSPPLKGEGNGVVLSNRFLVTANIEAKDGGREIAHGNGKVVRARLSDALYFWKTDQADLPDLGNLAASAEKFDLDLAKPLDQRMARLDHLGVTFHAKLGTQGERVERIRRLAEELAPVVARSLTSSLWGGHDPKRSEGGAGGGASPVGNLSAPPPLTLPGRATGLARPSDPYTGEGDLVSLAARAAVLAKADLQTEVVGEFPELQGQMGRTYALLQGEHPSVAAAIEEHYKPQGPSDVVPTDPVSVCVALADKLDTLVGFWAIDEKPTGSKDPFALRRAALGVIRILVENGVRLGLCSRIRSHFDWVVFVGGSFSLTKQEKAGQEGFAMSAIPTLADARNVVRQVPQLGQGTHLADELKQAKSRVGKLQQYIMDGYHLRLFERVGDIDPDVVSADLLSFFHDRLKVYLRDQGARHDLIDAVLASGSSRLISPLEGEMSPKATEGGAPSAVSRETPPSALPGISPSRGEITSSPNDDLLTIVRRVEALGAFLDTDDGKNLLAGAKRAANILAAEEKKKTAVADAADPALFREPAETSLYEAVNQAEKEAGQAIRNEDFSGALAALSALREPVDSFFEDVLVNDEDASVRANRLALLARIRAATDQVADFSKIAG